MHLFPQSPQEDQLVQEALEAAMEMVGWINLTDLPLTPRKGTAVFRDHAPSYGNFGPLVPIASDVATRREVVLLVKVTD